MLNQEHTYIQCTH